MNEKHKATVIVSLIITLLAISMVWQGARQHAHILESQIRAAEDELRSTISAMEIFSFSPYQIRIKNLLQTHSYITEAFAARDRQLLLEATLPKYKALQAENAFFKIMHFHLPDGTSFLRLHNPTFHGDDLTQVRPMINAVHKLHKPTSGFEIGRHGPFFRVAEPIFHKGIYIGVVEFGIVAHQIVKMLEMKKDLKVTAFFDKDAFAAASRFDQERLRLLDNFQVILHGKDIFSQLPTDLELYETSQRLSLGTRSYILHCRPIFTNFKQQKIGGILVLQDITEALHSKKIYLLKSILFSGLILLMTLAVIYFYFDKVMGTLLSEIAERKKTEEALRTSEKRFRFLVHDLPKIAVQGYDKDRKVVLWNKGSELIYGYTEEEALGRQLEDLIIPPDMREFVINAINSWLDLGITIPDSELTLMDKNGDPAYVFSSHTLSYDFCGEAEIYCIDVDLKALKEAQENQLIMENKLHRAQKMEAIGLMAGGVAHDLNNILSGIVSYPEFLLTELPPDSSMRQPLEIIKESGSRAAAVVADLLTVARGVAKTTEIANPNDFITSYLQSPEYNELCRSHPHVDLVTNLPPPLKNIRCSSVHIMKALTNLINNAAEAIDEQGTITITTSLETVEDFFALEHDINQGEYCVIAVCDDGPGIADDDLARIFEPFFTKKIMGRSGTGLGLAVVWNTMQDHGGVVTAHSSEKGTCLKLYFPVCDEEITTPAQEENLTNYQGKGESILVVDDEKQQRLICEKILTNLGYQVHTAASGEEAVEFMQGHSIDLLILDMIMAPGIDGKETYSRINDLHPGQKAIIASGFSQSEAVKETIDLGAGQYIKKPYTMVQLGRAVKKELSPAQ